MARAFWLSAFVLCAWLSCSADEFDVVFDTSKPLGLRLDASLVIQGFQRVTNAKMPAESTGWLKMGDRLVAVNEKRVEGKALSDVQKLIAGADLPKRLRFDAAGGTNRTAEMAVVLDGAEGVHGHEGVLELWRGGMPLGTLPYLQAAFGGQTSCKPAPIVLATPQHGCFSYDRQKSARDPGSLSPVADAFVLAERGECAFTLKASQAQQASALGLIVVNDGPGRIVMPANEPGAASSGGFSARGGPVSRSGRRTSSGSGGNNPADDIVLPAVMIEEKDGQALKRLLADAAAAAAETASAGRGLSAAASAAAAAAKGRPIKSPNAHGGAQASPAKTSDTKPLLGRFVRKGTTCKPLTPPVQERNKGEALAGEVNDDGAGGLGDPWAPAGELYTVSQQATCTAPGREGRRGRRRATDADDPGKHRHTEGKYSEEEDTRGSEGLHHHVEPDVEGEGTMLDATGTPVRGKARAMSGGTRARRMLAARAALLKSTGEDDEGVRTAKIGGDGLGDDEDDEELLAVEVGADGGQSQGSDDTRPEHQIPAAELHARDEARGAAALAARQLRVPNTPLGKRSYLRSASCSESSGEYVRAAWSAPLPTTPLLVVPAVPAHGCEPLQNPPQETAGAAVLVQRGECPFGEKRSFVAASGAAMMIVSNDEPHAPLFAMTAVGDPPAAEISKKLAAMEKDKDKAAAEGTPYVPDRRLLPSIMVSQATGALLKLRLLQGAESLGFSTEGQGGNSTDQQASAGTGLSSQDRAREASGAVALATWLAARFPSTGGDVADGTAVAHKPHGPLEVYPQGNKKVQTPSGRAVPGKVVSMGPGSARVFQLDRESPYPILLPLGRPALAPLWEELASLIDPTSWPEESQARRKLYLRLSRLHHPDRMMGSNDRFELLQALYKRAQAKYEPQATMPGGVGDDGWNINEDEL